MHFQYYTLLQSMISECFVFNGIFIFIVMYLHLYIQYIYRQAVVDTEHAGIDT